MQGSTRYPHIGLYFTQTHIDSATQYAADTGFSAAWELFHTEPATEVISDPLALLIWQGQRYRFMDDLAAGEQALELLPALLENAPIPLSQPELLNSLMRLTALAQGIELVRGHEAYAELAQARDREAFAERLHALHDSIPTGDTPYLHGIWFALLDFVGGIVLERSTLIEQGAAVFRQIVVEDIRPTGNITRFSESKFTKTSNFWQTVVSLKALVLMAEAAAHIGIDLWGYHQRGVSIKTAALYPLYYYYYPEKWKWDKTLGLDAAQEVVKQHGSWLELLNRHIGKPTPAIDLILNELRPIFDATGGGLVTLSHSVPPPPKRRGLFR